MPTMQPNPDFTPMTEDELEAMKADLVNDRPHPLNEEIRFFQSLVHWSRLKYARAGAQRVADATRVKPARKSAAPIDLSLVEDDLMSLL